MSSSSSSSLAVADPVRHLSALFTACDAHETDVVRTEVLVAKVKQLAPGANDNDIKRLKRLLDPRSDNVPVSRSDFLHQGKNWIDQLQIGGAQQDNNNQNANDHHTLDSSLGLLEPSALLGHNLSLNGETSFGWTPTKESPLKITSPQADEEERRKHKAEMRRLTEEKQTMESDMLSMEEDLQTFQKENEKLKKTLESIKVEKEREMEGEKKKKKKKTDKDTTTEEYLTITAEMTTTTTSEGGEQEEEIRKVKKRLQDEIASKTRLQQEVASLKAELEDSRQGEVDALRQVEDKEKELREAKENEENMKNELNSVTAELTAIKDQLRAERDVVTAQDQSLVKLRSEMEEKAAAAEARFRMFSSPDPANGSAFDLSVDENWMRNSRRATLEGGTSATGVAAKFTSTPFAPKTRPSRMSIGNELKEFASEFDPSPHFNKIEDSDDLGVSPFKDDDKEDDVRVPPDGQSPTPPVERREAECQTEEEEAVPMPLVEKEEEAKDSKRKRRRLSFRQRLLCGVVCAVVFALFMYTTCGQVQVLERTFYPVSFIPSLGLPEPYAAVKVEIIRKPNVW